MQQLSALCTRSKTMWEFNDMWGSIYFPLDPLDFNDLLA